jgi:hypothetical protein
MRRTCWLVVLNAKGRSELLMEITALTTAARFEDVVTTTQADLEARLGRTVLRLPVENENAPTAAAHAVA